MADAQAVLGSSDPPAGRLAAWLDGLAAAATRQAAGGVSRQLRAEARNAVIALLSGAGDGA